MHDIEKLRLEVDQIHHQLFELFRRRLILTRKIWEIKKHKGLPLVDLAREEKIIHQFDSMVVDKEEQKAVQSIFGVILKETKSYLEVKLK